MRDLRLGHDQRHDRLGAKLAHRSEPMIAVRRPVLSAARGNGDHWIEIPVELVDGVGDTRDVRFREIALERRWLDRVDWKRGENLPMRAKWISIDSERGAAVVLDGASQRLDRRRRLCARQSARIQ